MDQVEVLVEVAPGLDASSPDLAAALSQKIKNTIGLSMKINLQAAGSLPGSEGGKLSRVEDRR
jgi:phenylacetate-CoA ligase